jgi:hypothetical protein
MDEDDIFHLGLSGTVADELAVQIADVADTAGHMPQRGSARAPILPSAIGHQPVVAVGLHIRAGLQIRPWGKSLGL